MPRAPVRPAAGWRPVSDLITEGDTVRYFFRSASGTRLEYRTAIVTKVYEPATLPAPKYVHVDLVVDFSEAELLQHGFTAAQTHVRRGVLGQLQSGQWMPVPQTAPAP